MKNLLLPLFITLLIVSCNTEEILDDAAVTGEPGDIAQQEAKSEPGSSADNPIVVTARFVDLVRYTVTTCDANNQPNSRSLTPLRLRGVFYIPYKANIGPERFFKETNVDGCFTESRTGSFGASEYKFGVYYEIYGEVVRLGQPVSTRSYWFKDIPNSNQIQRVTFSEDGSKTYSAPLDFPYEENLNCTGLKPFPTNFAKVPSGTRGTRVIHGQTFVYEFNGTSSIQFVGLCTGTSTGPVDDICEGVEVWVRGKRYVNGDKVTYNGVLFEVINGRWVRQGPCAA